MEKIQSLAGASVGHVRACFSGRCRGFAAPVDLMRAHLRAVNRCAVRRRVAQSFAGYLVTDAGPDVLTLFSGRRGDHAAGADPDCVTGCEAFLRVGFGRVFDFAIDAPGVIAAGSMRAGERGAFASVANRWREAWRRGLHEPVCIAERGPVGDEWPVWRDSAGRVVWLGGGVYAKGLRAGFDDCRTGYLLDAYDFVPDGSTKQYLSAGKVCAARSDVMRPGWFE